LQNIIGVYKYSGDVFVEGKKLKLTSTSAAIEAGIVYLTEDRKEEGLSWIKVFPTT